MKPSRLILSIFSLELCLAWATTMTGTLLPEIIKDYHLRLGEAGLLGTAQSLIALCAILAAGVVSLKLGSGRLLAWGGLALTIFSVCMALAPSYTLFLAGIGLFGLGIGLVDPMTNAELAEVTGSERGRFLSLLHMSYGIGAALTPLVIAALLGFGFGWRTIVGLGAVFSFLAWQWFARQHSQKIELPSEVYSTHFGNAPFKDPRFYAIAAAMFFYAGAYRCLSMWMVTFLRVGLSASPAAAAGSLSLLFACVTAGRFVTSKTSEFLTRPLLLVLYGIGGAMSLALFYLGGMGGALAGLGLFGLTTAGIYPIVTAYGVELFPGRSGLVTGLIYGTGTGAGIILPQILGMAAESWGLQRAMTLTFWEMSAAGCFFVLLWLLQRGSERVSGVKAGKARVGKWRHRGKEVIRARHGR